MPVVPQARNTVDLPSPGVNARVETPNMGAGGEMIGRSLEGLGGQISDAAERQAQIDTIHDHAAIKEATNHVIQWYTEAGYTGPNAFFSQDGKNAVAGQPMITKGLDSLIEQQRASLNNPRQREMFDLAITPQRQEWAVRIAEHAATQEKAYDRDQSGAIQKSSAELAKVQYINDPTAAEKQIDTGLTEVDRFWRSQGVPDDFITSKKLEYSSGIYKDVGANLAYAGRDGPKLAQALVDQHGASMTADDRYAVTTHARTAQNTIDAEDRRAASEQRQLANEAKHDARDRATSAAANLDTNIPLAPKEFATAIADAQTAGDEALVRRLTDGQTKNTALFVHRNDTPAQLQDTINSLSASIAKAGAKADPAQIIQRDALQGLHNHIAEQIKTNGLAWASNTLGTPPPALNLNSEASIQARADYVRTAQKRAGTDMGPFQPDEVVPYAQTWRTGDANAKAGLVMRLARFNDLAPAAAQQIAPNDAGLVHLIGLASHSNKGVAISRVTQAMAGYEAMKTEGRIVGKLATQPEFNTWTGSALQFMPGARDGVFTVAKALLAQDASQHGWSDENAADSKAWYRAVNSALGAYNRGDTQYGGLAAFNGAQTVLPENMSLDDFEQRLSRADGPHLRAASNGLPVTGNGTPLTATDIKQMHFIPVDDGVYRLENGGSFVHTKDGQPFEINVRKLSNLDAQLAAHGYVRR